MNIRSTLIRSAHFLSRALANLRHVLLGDFQWNAPPWLKLLGTGASRSLLAARAHKRLSAALLAGLIAAGFAGYYGYAWWQARPKPQEADFSLKAPAITDYANEGKVQPLLLDFDSSVAPLAGIGKPVPQGISLQPEIKGTWTWESETRLSFQPEADWPIDTAYSVSLAKKGLLASHILLKEYKRQTRTPAFSLQINNSEFYQDPTNPAAKKAVFELGFSHPVQRTELEKRIHLSLKDQAQGLWGRKSGEVRFTVSYDKLGLAAWIHSEPLRTPDDDSAITLDIEAGNRAERSSNVLDKPSRRVLRVPGRNSLAIQNVSQGIAQDAKGDPEHLIFVDISASTTERAIEQGLKAWLLPVYKTGGTPEERKQPWDWSNPAEITDAVLAESSRLPLQLVAGEREHNERHAFRHSAPVGRYVYLQIDKGLESFGGYLLPRRFQQLLLVQPFPPLLSIAGKGALLPLSGDKRIAILTRDLPGLHVELGRVLPSQLQHLISQSSGDFASPDFFGNVGIDNLSERFEKSIPLKLAPGKSHFESLDLAEYLQAAGKERRGIFLLRTSGYEPGKGDPASRHDTSIEDHNRREYGSDYGAEGDETVDVSSLVDQRLILVTDLGILAKRSLDGSQDVYVQSIATGQPVAGAQVEVIGRNGLPLMSRATDPDGHVRFDKLDGLRRERSPLLYLVRKEGDLSFLPLGRQDRLLDTSRFDVGGLHNVLDAGKLSAHLFSDRGLYRPGDTLHIGMIVKAQKWEATPAGMPLEVLITDPRGLTVKREQISLAPGGLNEVSHTPPETAPTGNYSINLYLVGEKNRRSLIGSTEVKVQEFQPDRMKVAARLSSEAAEGWVSPQELKLQVDAQNLFGTPAPDRRVESSITLSPVLPAFRSYPDFRFHDPRYAKRGFTSNLPEGRTDAEGKLSVDLDLARFDHASYRLWAVARVFEPEGGRSVTADTSALVSEAAFMVGYKADGDLGYVAKGSKRSVELVAIDPQAKRTASGPLSLELVERRYVSVLARQRNGTYRYESRPKDVGLSSRSLEIPVSGLKLALDASRPGNFFYRLNDKAGLQVMRFDYSVAGAGNLTRELERNAELQLALKSRDVTPGEDIEISIRAPYTGTGLITIERERVFTHKWFRSDTPSSVQKIRLPADFEGNGYVTVQFVRDAASTEIYMSPLSWGTVPFSVNRGARTNRLKLSAPAKIKPGQKLEMKLSASQPTRAIVFAVDEGILQVARYKLADPLDHFFQKRALEVQTRQILDLILPDFRQLTAGAAPGGDEEGALARQLNPFKRKREQPAVWWSGIVDVSGERSFSYTVPETFNGSLRLMAVAVSDSAMGIAEGKSVVQGDFVLLPSAPLAVAPGDEFEVGVGVANNVAASGKGAPVSLSLQVSPHLQLLGPASQQLKINARGEASARFRLKALDGAQARLGSASLRFTATLDDPKLPGHRASLGTDLSVRPATPYYARVQLGSFQGKQDLELQRSLHREHRKVEATLSPLPLVLARGLSLYLDGFSHACTEQLTSKILPALVLGRHPALFDKPQDQAATQLALDKALTILRTRQNASGGFGLWTASVEADAYASVYATHMMLEARERGFKLPADMLERAMKYVATQANQPVRELHEARLRAYAIYLLVREGIVASAQLASLRETLDKVHGKSWQSDSVAAWMAASYRLMKDERQARSLIEPLLASLRRDDKWSGYAYYYDPLVRDAQILYLGARHFPELTRKLAFADLKRISDPLLRGWYQTHSAAYSVLALEAWAGQMSSSEELALQIASLDAQGKATALPASAGIVASASIPEATRRLRLSLNGSQMGYYSLGETGFDRSPPQTELKQGLEILREYLDLEGRPVQSVKVGDEVIVRLRFRASGRGPVHNAVLVDLLPGGFEPVLDTSEGSKGLASSGNWQPVESDVREERVVLYGSIAGDKLQEYQYRLRATNAGKFVVPPTYGESMYEREVQARSLAGVIEVKRPGQ